MRAWHNGTRKENIKACSVEKLKNYLRICKQNYWSDEADQIVQELSSRGIELPSSNNTAQQAPQRPNQDVIDEIFYKMNK